jgi:DNA-binding transcriptional ArsR family regulator
MFIKQIVRKFQFILLAVGIIAVAGGVVHGAQKDKDTEKKQFVMNEAQLQSHVMSFADRFASIMSTVIAQFEKQNPTGKTRYMVLELITFSLSHAYIIAGESDPDVALLDMLSMVTLGRIFFEEEGPSRYGKVVAPVTKGYQKAEADIRQIAAKVLTPDKMLNLMTIVKRWRKENPEAIFFPLIRFSNFAADRRESTLTRAEDPEGLFESVESAVESVEEMRLLAERGTYLATRLPQLWGLFGDLWLTRWMNNPDLQKTLSDVQQLSEGTAGLAAIAEKLPDQIAMEREAAIKQAMENVSQERNDAIKQIMGEVSAERKAAMDELLAEERRIEERLISQMIEAMERAERQGEELVDHTVQRLAILMGIGLIGYIIARLIIVYASNKMKPSVKNP